MPGKIILGVTSNYIDSRYDLRRDTFEYTLLIGNITKGNTHVLIFSRHQEEQMSLLLECKKINVLFKSKPCINPTEGHESSRNTVVVFERKSK